MVKKNQNTESLVLVIAGEEYGIPELKEELQIQKIGNEFETVTGERGIDSMLAAVFEHSLFGDVVPKLVIAESVEERDALVVALSKVKPESLTVVVIRAATELQKKKYSSLGFSILELKPRATKEQKDSGEAFTLARLVASGNAKDSWTMWKDMEARRVAIDSVIPALWWQLKKSYGFSRTTEEKKKLLSLMKSIVEIVHESRRGTSSLSKMFEQMLLSLRR